MNKILITGAAGFIGSNLVKYLLRTGKGLAITGVDNLNDYYDVNLKLSRLEAIKEVAENVAADAIKEAAEKTTVEAVKNAAENAEGGGNTFSFVRGDIADAEFVRELFEKEGFDVVVNLAAQAGVRYSIENPDAYIQSNIVGFYNILEGCRHFPVEHLVYASSSSVYGGNEKVPFSEEDKVDNPVSLYAATKKADELLAAAYSNLYGIPATGLRFFTVYGPAGRPDMSYFLFADTFVKGGTIKIFNYGNCRRDFTYIDDIVEGVARVMKKAPQNGGHKVYNIGNSSPENLLEFVDILQQELQRAGVLPEGYDFEAHRELVPMQKGDVEQTYADTDALERDFGFRPSTPLKTGLRNFANWYSKYINTETAR